MENYIFWSEIGSGFEEPGGTPPPREFPGVYPPPGAKDQSCDRLEGVSSTQGTRDDKIYGVFLNVKANHLKWFLADTAETKREASHARRS